MIKIVNFTRSDLPLWESLLRSNSMLSPYQSADFMLKYKKTAKFGKSRLFLVNRIIKLTTDEFNVLCPISVDRYKKTIYLLGDRSAVGYCDFVYSSNLSDKNFEDIIWALKNHFSGYTLKFNKLNEKSQFCSFLLKRYKPLAINECVNLSLGDDSEAYYNSLSKHARQNIRTAYNRLKRDGKVINFEVISGKMRLTSEQKNEIGRVYARRMKTKLGKETLPLSLIYFSQRYFNSIVRLLNNLDTQFHALLYIDGKLAAYMSGLFSEDSSKIVVPKLSMNDEFDFYDPGIILIYETIKYLCVHYPNIDLDLSRGNEKYKYMMGGTTHFNYSFTI